MAEKLQTANRAPNRAPALSPTEQARWNRITQDATPIGGIAVDGLPLWAETIAAFELAIQEEVAHLQRVINGITRIPKIDTYVPAPLAEGDPTPLQRRIPMANLAVEIAD